MRFALQYLAHVELRISKLLADLEPLPLPQRSRGQLRMRRSLKVLRSVKRAALDRTLNQAYSTHVTPPFACTCGA
ncbi:hypothetical protein A6A06_16570 [Streptomyces sp. CB02923]|uniref:hypothetical protein n=1 Tax=Streptomyces sp. CB02923 TaxID=1718985 RepID=UPI00093D4C99|nr:hypothetical protein [Streptomyces sp. CB02923]OKI02620.1 hypothetical protein A6A06_16570 [Streptomyces sp. CB02923]